MPSYVSHMLENSGSSLSPEDEELIVWTAGEIYGGLCLSAYLGLTDITSQLALIRFVHQQGFCSISIDDKLQTISIISSFVLAMILFPEVQRKAQAEIDAIVGLSRFPSFADRGALPYVNAVVKEAMRWNPVISTSKELHFSRLDDNIYLSWPHNSGR